MSKSKLRIKTNATPSVMTYVILGISVGVIMYPLLWMVSTSLKDITEMMQLPPVWFPKTASLNSYVSIWSTYPIAYYFRNSIVVVLASTSVSIIVSCMAGYAASRSRARWVKPFMTFLLVLQMFPAVMLLIPYYTMLTRYRLVNTLAGLVLPNIAFSMPFCSWMMMGYFRTIPSELDDSAMIDGCDKYQSFSKVILPLVLPGVAATIIYSFIHGWNEYMFSATLIRTEELKTLTVGIAQMVGEYRTLWNDIMAASVLTCLPLIIVFVFLQKYFISSLTAGAVKG